jgi:hypothetical protein
MPTRAPITAPVVVPAPSPASMAVIGPAARKGPTPGIANTPAPHKMPSVPPTTPPVTAPSGALLFLSKSKSVVVGLSGIRIESFDSGNVAETSASMALSACIRSGKRPRTIILGGRSFMALRTLRQRIFGWCLGRLTLLASRAMPVPSDPNQHRHNQCRGSVQPPNAVVSVQKSPQIATHGKKGESNEKFVAQDRSSSSGGDGYN